MSGGIKLLVYFICSVLLSAASGPLVIALMRRLKAKQTVLGYVKQHEHKSGTPTMGGFIFLLPALIISLIEHTAFSLVAISLTMGFCLLGFLDDFIKIRFSRNLGLKPYQKIIGQLGLSAAAGYFAYASGYINAEMFIPFAGVDVNLSYGVIAFVIFIFVATANSVNLTDGLDGLAGTSCTAYFLGFGLLCYLLYADALSAGDAAYAKEVLSLAAFCASLFGGLIGYLLFNSYPAKIMMGDTGSLALGAACASVAVFCKNPLLIVTSGIMFVWSSISVILQVLSFKLTGKRIFLMAPFHHHLEMKGMKETQIVALYFAISMLGAALTLIFARA